MNSCTVYEKLYNNTKAKFTIVSGDSEYTLGEYMMMKAGKKSEKTKSGASKALVGTGKAVSSLISFINDKITVKNPPAKDKTIKKFPMRTSAAAFLSAMVMSVLALSFAIFSAAGINSSTSPVADHEITESEAENESFNTPSEK